MTRITRTAITTGVAALATAAALATIGSAQSPAGTTLHLVSKPAKGGFMPKRIREGSRFGFVTRVSGDDSGSARDVCTAIGRKALCTLQVQLSKGTLSAQGIVPEHSHDNPVAIIGGTGAYNGARGTGLVTDVTSTKTRVEVQLLR
jgi:hypothetical protein